MLDQWIQTLQAGDCLAERDLKKLCLMVRGVKVSISIIIFYFAYLLHTTDTAVVKHSSFHPVPGMIYKYIQVAV